MHSEIITERVAGDQSLRKYIHACLLICYKTLTAIHGQPGNGINTIINNYWSPHTYVYVAYKQSIKVPIACMLTA